MELIRLKDFMTEPFYFYIEKSKREDIINKALEKTNKNIKELSSKINCSQKTLKELFKGETTECGKRFIHVKFLESLSNISETNIEEIEPKILEIRRGKNTRPVAVKLPIETTPELALLTAKALGDGCICSDWRFDYKNKEMELVNEVIKSTELALGKSKSTTNPRKNNAFELKFSSVIGFILNKIGVPKGYKIHQETKIPYWITNGDSKIKSHFLRGLFDDEACVDSKGKRIIIAFAKSNSLKDSLIDFLNSLKILLKEFNIKTGSINFQEEYQGRVVLRFGIYGKENLQNFQDYINFSHPKKRNSLKELLKSYIDKSKNKRAILGTILNSDMPLTTSEIAKTNNINIKLALSHLSDLAKQGEINKGSGCSPMLWSRPEIKIINKKESILKALSNEELTSLEISNKLNLNQKYVFNILKKLKTNGLIISKNSHPKFWKFRKTDLK